ncbi:MAG: glycosyltransferase family 4 protein, partial [Anaerolineales bacterium]
MNKISTDILVVTTSGGEYDLGPLSFVDTDARLRIVWIQSHVEPHQWEAVNANYVYMPSNWVRRSVMEGWQHRPAGVFVTYNGVVDGQYSSVDSMSPKRESHRLIYFSHPSKGLAVAAEIVRRLRASDEQYHLEVFGGSQLWGGSLDISSQDQPGIRFHGTIGQEQLARELELATYSLCLQDRLEPFGNVIVESMRAGCIVLASSVGAFPELIDDGVNGFLVKGGSWLESGLQT